MPFGDILTAMITPFTKAGEVDYETAWSLAEYLVQHGSDGIVVAGSTGESATLSHDEKVAMYRTVVEAVGSRAKVVAGTGTYDTRESIELTRQAAEVGCHAVMAVTPYYNKPPQEGLYRHFVAIAEASQLPLMIYNVPSRTVRRIEVDTIARLAAHRGIVAVKDAVEDLGFTSRTKRAVPADFVIYSGQDELTLPILAVGGSGVVSVASHLVGPQLKRMVTAANEKDWETARAIHLALLPLFGALFIEPNPIPLKAALNAVWGPVGEPRLPLVPAEPATLAALEQALVIAQSA